MLKFRKALFSEKQILIKLTSDSLEGVFSFSFLLTSGENFYESFFVGVNEKGEIKSIVFDSGNEYFLVYGEEFPEIFPRPDKTVMIYDKKTSQKGSARSLEGREILGTYCLMSENNCPSFDDERRYVLRLRAKNSGYAEVFGTEKQGRLVSTASVSSMNGKYALISDVFTKKEERRQGLAGECLTSALSYCLEKGKIPVLVCEEKMCDYYKKAGFKVYGKM